MQAHTYSNADQSFPYCSIVLKLFKRKEQKSNINGKEDFLAIASINMSVVGKIGQK